MEDNYLLNFQFLYRDKQNYIGNSDFSNTHSRKQILKSQKATLNWVQIEKFDETPGGKDFLNFFVGLEDDSERNIFWTFNGNNILNRSHVKFHNSG